MGEASLRIDKWLWYARFFKSRSLAAKLCQAGTLRLDGSLVHKAHAQLRVGDVLTFPQGRHIRVVKVLDLGSRRGPVAEAQALYLDLKPPDAANRLPGEAVGTAAARPAGSGRPTKKQRRALDQLRGGA